MRAARESSSEAFPDAETVGVSTWAEAETARPRTTVATTRLRRMMAAPRCSSCATVAAEAACGSGPAWDGDLYGRGVALVAPPQDLRARARRVIGSTGP